MPNLSNTPSDMVDHDGHLTPDNVMELRRRLLQGDRLAVTVELVSTPGTMVAPGVILPTDPAKLANALTDLVDALDPRPAVPGREEPLEAPELAATLADAYEAAVAAQDAMDDVVTIDASSRVSDDLLCALGAVLASAYLEGRRRA